jgi:hypothetical protein
MKFIRNAQLGTKRLWWSQIRVDASLGAVTQVRVLLGAPMTSAETPSEQEIRTTSMGSQMQP